MLLLALRRIPHSLRHRSPDIVTSNEPRSFSDFFRSRAGRRELGWWAGSGATIFTICFWLVTWYTGALVPIFFWPFVAAGGAVIGLRFWLWKWQAAAKKDSGRVE